MMLQMKNEKSQMENGKWKMVFPGQEGGLAPALPR
jgi:hypothetical protein